MTLRKASHRTLRIITFCACLFFAVLLVVLIVTLKESSSTYGCDKATWTCRTGLGSMTQQDCEATCKESSSTYGCDKATWTCRTGLGSMTQQDCEATCKDSSSTYGCDKATRTCQAGLGSMTQQDCEATCKDSSSTYGCNPASGKCEPGFGQMPESCPHATCEKLTWQCDEQSWDCKDTQTVTHTSQSGCKCDPGLASSTYTLLNPPNFPNQQGTNCGVGWTLDKTGKLVNTCLGNLCCASNYCGSFVAADDYSLAVCPTLTQPDCKTIPNSYSCQWDSGQSVCQAVAYDVGQCAACTNDDQCSTLTSSSGKCVNQVCQPSNIKCYQMVEGINPVAPGLFPPAIDSCMQLLDNQAVPDPTTCSQITQSYECAKTVYQSECADKTGKVWYQKRAQCMIQQND